jgi:hypothetical protein
VSVALERKGTLAVRKKKEKRGHTKIIVLRHSRNRNICLPMTVYFRHGSMYGNERRKF